MGIPTLDTTTSTGCNLDKYSRMKISTIALMCLVVLALLRTGVARGIEEDRQNANMESEEDRQNANMESEEDRLTDPADDPYECWRDPECKWWTIDDYYY